MANKAYNIARFATAQDRDGTYERALAELREGRKRTHWSWFVFPQLRGLGRNYNSRFYGISGLGEARAYMADTVLAERLRAVCREMTVQAENGRTPVEVLGGIDANKFRSCLTLFNTVAPNDVFAEALDKIYGGEPCPLTLKRLETLHI